MRPRYCPFPTLLFVLSALLSAASAAAQSAPTVGPKDLVAVLDLAGVNAGKGQLAAVSDELRVRLLNTGKFRLMDRDQTNSVLNEQVFQQQACTSQDCAVKAGKLLGVRHLVTGRVTHVNGKLWQLTAQIVDVESAETLKAVTVTQRGPFEKLLGESVPALALQLADAAQAAEKRGACRADTQKFCADVKPGDGRIARCLAKHQGALSPECREIQAAQQTRPRRNLQDCQADTKRLCANVPRGGGRIVACLKSHSSELSPACRESLPAEQR